MDNRRGNGQGLKRKYSGSPGFRKSRQLVNRSKSFRRIPRTSLIPRPSGRGQRGPSPPHLQQGQTRTGASSDWFGRLMGQSFTPHTSDFESGMELEHEPGLHTLQQEQPRTVPTSDWMGGLMGQTFAPHSSDFESGMELEEGELPDSPPGSPQSLSSLPSMSPPRTNIFQRHLQGFQDVFAGEWDRKDRQKQELDRRGYQEIWDDTDDNYEGEPRWVAPSPKGGHIPIMPKPRRSFDAIRRSYEKSRQHKYFGPKTHLRERGSPQWTRSRQLVSRSRDILNRRPVDTFEEKLEAKRRKQRRDWHPFRDRRVHQKSDYLMREQNLGYVRGHMQDRFDMAYHGHPLGSRSDPTMRRVVPTLPRQLPTIYEDDGSESGQSPYNPGDFSPLSSNSSDFRSDEETATESEWDEH